MSKTFCTLTSSLVLLLLSIPATAQINLEAMVERGKELYNAPASCAVCHKATGEGLIGPDIRYGPTPAQILEQLQDNPQMAIIMQEFNPDDQALMDVALYIRTLGGLEINEKVTDANRKGLALQRAKTETDLIFPKTERDLAVESIQSWDSVVADWQRRSNEGPLRAEYSAVVTREFEPAEAKFNPEPGKTYFYENVGNSANISVLKEGAKNAESTQVVVGDAQTHEVIASYELPVNLRAAVHTTVVSPDGKYVYIVGSKPETEPTNQILALDAPATLIKVDAITLQPVKQMTMGGRLHHAFAFQDKIVLDTFSRDPDGLDVMMLDPNTDEIVGGVRDEDLGGSSYTAYSDNEFIYILMEPVGYASHRSTGMAGAQNLYRGNITTMKPFWIAKLDPETWEVVQEYPYPGFRGDWIAFDAKKEFMYVPSGGTSNMSKINMETGEIVWTTGTGISPYGASLTADESEVWVANKGEHTGHLGRTVSVINSTSGRKLATLFSGYEVDHILLAPNGKEMWATSNGEGSIYVFDVATREQLAVIPMPQNGDPHGLAWVHYDEDGNSKLVRDQNSFHGGVNPALGTALDY